MAGVMIESTRQRLERKFRAMTPKRRVQLLNALIEFANCELDEMEVSEMTDEQVDAQLRKEGFTDADFERMNRNIQEVIDKYRPMLKSDPISPADFSARCAMDPYPEMSECSHEVLMEFETWCAEEGIHHDDFSDNWDRYCEMRAEQTQGSGG